MRLSDAFSVVVLFLTSLALANFPNGGWSSSTTITLTTSYSTTLTVTKYLTYANATSTSTSSSHIIKPTGWNTTSSYPTSATTLYSPTSTTQSTTQLASTSSVFPPIASATGNAGHALNINLGMAALVGAAALLCGSL